MDKPIPPEGEKEDEDDSGEGTETEREDKGKDEKGGDSEGIASADRSAVLLCAVESSHLPCFCQFDLFFSHVCCGHHDFFIFALVDAG